LRVNLYPGNPVLKPTEECPQLAYQAGELVCGSEVPHINTQIKQYLEERGGFTHKQLVLIWGGANDLRDVGLDPNGPESAIANVVRNLATAVATVATAGAKDVVVLNQLNAARAPITQALCGGAPPCLAQVEAAVRGFNAALSTALKELQTALDQQGYPTRVHYVDVFSAAEVAFDLSVQFGEPFTNTTDAALIPDPANPPFAKPIPGDAEDYLFWDVIHPTGKAYRIIAYQVCKALDRQIPGFKPRCVDIKDN
jgi:phospholipase/lecithinase/hemolysin